MCELYTATTLKVRTTSTVKPSDTSERILYGNNVSLLTFFNGFSLWAA